jgi:hypothetical protein
MSEKARNEWKKQMENLKKERQKALQVRAFLVSEREIVLRLLEKSMPGGDTERLNNLRTRVHEKDRQLQLVERELKELSARLKETEERFHSAGMEDQAGG